MKILNKLFPETKINQQVQVDKKTTESQVSVEEQKIQELFTKHGEKLTPEKLEVVKTFLAEAEGTLDSKLATLELALEKDIELTGKNLKAMHIALEFEFRLPILEPEIDKAYKELPKNEKHKVRELMQKGMSLEAATKVIVKQCLEKLLFPESKEVVATDTEPKEVVESDAEVELELKTKTIQNEVKHDSELVDRQVDIDVDEEAWIEDVFEVLSEHMDEVVEALAPVAEAALFEIKEPIQKFLQIVMTEDMVKTKETFDIYQKQIVQQLEQVLDESPKVPIKEVLVQVIDKLDHIIMKTDVPLYTDMKTERDLLRSSTELEQARQLLDKDIDKAFEIIKEVKSLIDGIKFKPVKQKMFGVAKKVLPEVLYEKELIKQIPIEFESMKSSPRTVLETLRSMGLNHENEVSEQLNKRGKEMRAPANMKMILMKLEESAQQRVQAKDTLDHLTGQQLLNKLEIKSSKQQMMFNVPVKIDGDMKQLKVHVNAKKDHQKIDWQNSRLYFVIHLDKLGDTGVLVDVNKGNVSITVKNDQEGLEEKMASYVEDAVVRLEEIGFKMANIKYEPLTESTTSSVDEKKFEVSL